MENKIQILKDLVKFNTINDEKNKEFLDYIEDFLKKLNFKVEKREKYLIMSFGEEYELGFVGHSDTVDVTDGWNSNPFEVIQKNNELFGLGVCDMKGGIAAFLNALIEIDLNKLKKGIKVYITYDEEIGFAGIEGVCKFEKNFPTYNIIGEPTNNVMMIGCKGLLAIELKIKGIKVHSSIPDKGESAIDSMMNLLVELKEFYNKEIKSYKNDVYEVPYTTMNIGLINGGCGKNSVAPNCSSYIDFRIAKEDHIVILKNKIFELCEKYNAEVDIDVDINSFFNDVEFVEGNATAGFMTEASFLTGKRIILGPGPVTAHEVDEHITVESYRKTIEQYKSIIEHVCM